MVLRSSPATYWLGIDRRAAVRAATRRPPVINHLPLAVGLSRRASRTIKQNLFFSLDVVAVLIPMTILGVGISIAAIAHEGSTLVVVVNAPRLLNFDDAAASE